MPRFTRGVLTLVGVVGAVALIWLAGRIGDDSTADYWALYGLVAAAGLTMALSQLLGGWTKWGWPRISGNVFLLGFLPALLVAFWVLCAGQPDENWFQRHFTSWSDDLGIGGFVGDLVDLAGPLAFLAGLTFGFTFDTSGPRTAVAEPAAEEPEPTPAPVVEEEAPTAVRHPEREPEPVTHPEREPESEPVTREPTAR